MNDVKIIAMYLPQYHIIPENEEFWGKGFTDWVTVKNAQPLYRGHIQPRTPLNDNYYDLSKKENVKWQCELARKYGLYGFGVYHYWFNNEKNLLTKPAEIMRDSDDIDINYFLTWDNGNWKRSWSNVSGNDWAPIADNPKDKHKKSYILIPYILGREKDWENHYNYCKTHFHSKRYMKKGNKPVFGIFLYDKELDEMCAYWDNLAKADGFDGMCFLFKYNKYKHIPVNALKFNYEPAFSGWGSHSILDRVINKLKTITHTHKELQILNYDKVWCKLIEFASQTKIPTFYHSAFVGYDDTPRRGRIRGIVVEGATPEKFKKYMSSLIRICKDQNKDYLFLTAWNEWGEGAYLEPDINNQFAYLEALQEAIIVNEK